MFVYIEKRNLLLYNMRNWNICCIIHNKTSGLPLSLLIPEVLFLFIKNPDFNAHLLWCSTDKCSILFIALHADILSSLITPLFTINNNTTINL